MKLNNQLQKWWNLLRFYSVLLVLLLYYAYRLLSTPMYIYQKISLDFNREWNKHVSYSRVCSTVIHPIRTWAKRLHLYTITCVWRILCCILWGLIREWLRNTEFIYNLYFDDPIATKLLEILWELIVIVFTEKKLSCIQNTVAIRFLLIYRAERKRKQTIYRHNQKI